MDPPVCAFNRRLRNQALQNTIHLHGERMVLGKNASPVFVQDFQIALSAHLELPFRGDAVEPSATSHLSEIYQYQVQNKSIRPSLRSCLMLTPLAQVTLSVAGRRQPETHLYRVGIIYVEPTNPQPYYDKVVRFGILHEANEERLASRVIKSPILVPSVLVPSLCGARKWSAAERTG